MKSFREYVIEGLRIVNKNKDNIKPMNKPREEKNTYQEKITISDFDDMEIIRTKHSKKIRDGEQTARDDSLRDAIILKAIKKAWKKGLQPNTKTVITYKNKKKLYDMMVIEWKKSQGKLILITSIQGSEKTPKTYFRESNKKDAKIMTEIYEAVETIELEEIE